MPPKSVPNGSAKVQTPNAEHQKPTNNLHPVIGINLGNSYASIAVYTKEDVAECIANEDGERQIATAISFHGEEIYVGNQAKHQLVKNAKNTIIGFRNLLGKKFAEISQSTNTTSAPVIQHPDIPDEPAYKVQVLQPAPTPLPPSSNFATPAASSAPTPRSEPVAVERVFSVSEVTTLFLQSLIKSAETFLGKKAQGAVLTVPTWFDDKQRSALEKAAADAGINVLQLLDDVSAVAGTTANLFWNTEIPADRTQLIVDVGASSLSLALLSVREGLAYSLATSSTPELGGDQIDDKLIKFFATEFTKKTKIPLTVVPATETADKRAEAKLRLAIEHTKRTISASPGAATCSVESLKDGFDFTGTINRMRFDLVAKPVYDAIAKAVRDLLESAKIDPHHVDEIVYVGGTASLPGLDETIILAGGFKEDIATPFAAGTVAGGGAGDPTTIISRGCAAQAALLYTLDQGSEIRKAYEHGSTLNGVGATGKAIGVLFPDPAVTGYEVGGTWIPVIPAESPVPLRRKIRFEAEVAEKSKKVAFEVWEVTEGFRVEKVKLPPLEGAEPDEEEEEEVKHETVKKDKLLGTGVLEVTHAIQIKGKGKDAGKWITSLELSGVVDLDGKFEFTLTEDVGSADKGPTATVVVPGSSS